MWTIHPRGESRVEEQNLSLPIDTSGDVTSLCWHVGSQSSSSDYQPNEPFLAAGTFGGLTMIWNVDGTLRANLPSPHGPVFSMRFNPSGTIFVTCSASGVFEIYDTKTWASIFKVPAAGRIWDCPGTIPCLAWLDDRRLAILGPDAPQGIVNCWQFDETHATSPFLRLIGHEEPINDIQYDKQSGFLATASDDHTVRLWKPDRSTPYREFRNHTGPVRAVAFQPTSEDTPTRILASASYDGSICFYDIITFKHLHSIGHQLHSFPNDRISCLSWSPDGKYLCTGDLEGVVGIWEWRDALPPGPFAIWAPDRIQEDQHDQLTNGTNGHKEDGERPVYSIQWQKNGQSFVVCRENRKVFCPLSSVRTKV